ncbi:hypothetical protein ACT3XG_14820 [Paenibacillus polymyxa]|uniref:hypothetical protein n=1 Tax=Paenibacillus TaxID=44249 RepID=UPI00142D1DA4|nr:MULTISPECIES: hypothetical protein [Paenibacillus]KAF6658896.1 hypothetical protein HFD99_01395 [Paenibacillus sp. EKM301P]UBS85429.1 hypothetical protein LAZ93_14775 [Paenibacillus polymyxa]WHX33948.1 hypothetical protein QNH38_15255 [Paenibacillus polymyxa]
MAELSGVVRVGSAVTVICYEGKDYVKVEGRARKGDIVLVRGDISDYLRADEFYGVNADEDGDEYVRDTDDDAFYFSERNYDGLTVFRGGVPTEILLAAQREELAKVTATIAELEAKLADEKTLKVGDYACRVATGQIVKVVFDDQSSLPFKTIPVLDSELDSDELDFYWWNTESQLVKLTPAEAKAAILTQVEAQFKEVA